MSVGQSSWVRTTALVVVGLVILSAGGRYEALAQVAPIQITAGDTVTLELDGNPSTGYTWVLQSGQEHLSLITVQSLGYVKPASKPGTRPVLGAPQKFQVLVTALSAGQARLVFDYVKAGEAKPARTAEFAIEILDDAASAQPDASDAERRDLFPDADDEVDAGGDPEAYQ